MEATLTAGGSSAPHPSLVARGRTVVVAVVVPMASRSGRDGATWSDPGFDCGGATRLDPSSCHRTLLTSAPEPLVIGLQIPCWRILSKRPRIPATGTTRSLLMVMRWTSLLPLRTSHRLLPALVSTADVLPVGLPDLIRCNKCCVKGRSEV
ncbi:unnamed protein product [Urochloa humidicola]